MAAIDTLITSLETSIELTDTPKMRELMGERNWFSRLRDYRERLHQAKFHKRLEKESKE